MKIRDYDLIDKYEGAVIIYHSDYDHALKVVGDRLPHPLPGEPENEWVPTEELVAFCGGCISHPKGCWLYPVGILVSVRRVEDSEVEPALHTLLRRWWKNWKKMH